MPEFVALWLLGLELLNDQSEALNCIWKKARFLDSGCSRTEQLLSH